MARGALLVTFDAALKVIGFKGHDAQGLTSGGYRSG
jgi:hypothetical protein